MMKKSKLITWLVLTGASIILPLIVLVIHLYIVTKDKNDDKRVRQLSRIDFIQDVDSTFANSFKNKVLSIDGVDAGYFNVSDKTFIYSYDPNIQNADRIFVELMKDNNYKATRYRTNDKLLASGCPVIDKSSITYKVASLFKF